MAFQQTWSSGLMNLKQNLKKKAFSNEFLAPPFCGAISIPLSFVLRD